MSLKSIEQHNNDVRYKDAYDLTGIECPDCKKELRWKTPGLVYLTSPPQADAICKNCGFERRVLT